MPLPIPTTQEIVDRNIANLEANLNQETPAHARSFNRVLAKMEALNYTELYRFAAERALQNFAMTATGEDLERIGASIGVIRIPAEACSLLIEIAATTGTLVPRGTGFLGEYNRQRYFASFAAEGVADVAEVTVVAIVPGSVGNLLVGDTLTIGSQISGVGTSAEVTEVLTVGAEQEDVEAYRQRVLVKMRTILGGGNAADYKVWGEGVAGVARVYPYAGKPSDSPPSYPGDRTVYVEATTDVDPDGIAPGSLLTEVAAAIAADPATGKSRPHLGLTDETLWVLSITRSSFWVEITGLDVSSEYEVAAKADVAAFLALYFLAVRPYVESIDPIQAKNNVLTQLTLSKIVQDVLSTYGGTAVSVAFGLDGESEVDSYTLAANEKAKLSVVTYAG